MTNSMITIARIYERPSPEGGPRVLVERLWPRGLTKEKAAVDLWLKEIAPSHELRTWYGHDPAKWDEFRTQYMTELNENTEAVGRLLGLLEEGSVTFVYAASDRERNSAVVLKEFIETVNPPGAR